MLAADQIHAHIEIKPRVNYGVNFPDRYLTVTVEGASRQRQGSLITISDPGHGAFALLDAVDLIAAKYGTRALDEQGIAVSESFFKRRKDESGWHRDELLAALHALDRRLDDARLSDQIGK
jgi:hypothetical protein